MRPKWKHLLKLSHLKIKIFWEGYNNLANVPQIFVAFSEYLNFNFFWLKGLSQNYYSLQLMNTLWRPKGNLLKFLLSLEHFWLCCYWLFWFVWLFGITNLEEKNLESRIIWNERFLLEIKVLKLLEAIQGVLKIHTSIKKSQWAIYR